MMKHSPLCTRDSSRQIYVAVATDGGDYGIAVSRDPLDEECGEDADEAARTVGGLGQPTPEPHRDRERGMMLNQWRAW